jgi:hypothetical protein
VRIFNFIRPPRKYSGGYRDKRQQFFPVASLLVADSNAAKPYYRRIGPFVFGCKADRKNGGTGEQKYHHLKTPNLIPVSPHFTIFSKPDRQAEKPYKIREL